MEGAWHMNRIGKNIKKARSEKGYTQEQLAQKLCVTRNTISNYETGHSNPDIEMLQLLAEALKTDPNTLIYGEKKEQSADQAWRKEILKKVIWLVIAGLIIMISASLIQYGGEIAKDTLQVPMWSPWLNSVAYPIAYMIIGSQIMALVLQACGKRNSEYRWIKAVFLILVAAILVWMMAATVSCTWIEYVRRVYGNTSGDVGAYESIVFQFFDSIWIEGVRIYVFHKWLWMLGWGVCGMLLAILKPKKKSAESAEN